MPEWAGKWKGGRYYVDDGGRRVFFIERRVRGRQRAIRLKTHDEELANSELVRFALDPEAFTRPAAIPETAPDPVFITRERITLYLESIRDSVRDHRAARASYLAAWSGLALDLRAVDARALRVALASFDGGHRGRTEALNAFARFLVKLGDLPTWRPLVNHRPPEPTRAEREAYSIEQLTETFHRLKDVVIRDVFLLRVSTGLHFTEIAQVVGARVTRGPLPDKGVALRELGTGHEICGVLQVRHKTKPRHRQSLNAACLAAALRLRDGVPYRGDVWEAIKPLVPSNLRHTFVTLAGEVGRLVTYTAQGVDRARIAQVIGHREGSTMTADRYDKTQVPPMIALPLPFSE